MRSNFATRWSPDLVQSGLALMRGSPSDPPFGTTEDGLVDLRGIPIKDVSGLTAWFLVETTSVACMQEVG